MNSYQSLEASLHDAFWHSLGPSQELPLLVEFLKENPGTALEVGCGSGRLLLPLREQGFEVEGLELSQEMLELCRQKPGGEHAPLHLGNMDDWSAPRSYDSILVPAFTLQLSANPAAALAHWHRALKPGGRIYVSTFTPLAEMQGDLPEMTWYPDHQTILENGNLATIHTKHQLDPDQQKLHRWHRYEIFSPDGTSLNSHESQQTLWWYRRTEWKSLWKEAGFMIEQQIPDFRPKRKSLAQAQIISTIARRTP